MSVKVDFIEKRQKGNKLKYVNNFFHLGFILYYLKKRNSEHNLCFLGEVKVYLAKNLGGSVIDTFSTSNTKKTNQFKE